MDLPDNVQTGIVTGRYIVDVIDGADANLEPDAVSVQGRIVFTASVPYLQNPAALPVPVTIMRAPIIGVLDADGYLCTPYPGTLEPLYRGVHLIATDDPDLVPQNWTWDVTYMFDPVGGKKLDIPPHGFALPTGSTVDLTNVAKVPSSPGYSLPQAEAAVLRAEQAAQQSAEDAADAAAAALRAEQAAGATDEGVASMLADPATETGQLMNDFLSSKANVTDVNAELKDKADRVATEAALSLKADAASVNSSLAGKADLRFGVVPIGQLPSGSLVNDENIAGQVNAPQTGAAIDSRINTQVTPVVEQITADYIASDPAVVDAAAAAVDANPAIAGINSKLGTALYFRGTLPSIDLNTMTATTDNGIWQLVSSNTYTNAPFTGAGLLTVNNTANAAGVQTVSRYGFSDKYERQIQNYTNKTWRGWERRDNGRIPMPAGTDLDTLRTPGARYIVSSNGIGQTLINAPSIQPGTLDVEGTEGGLISHTWKSAYTSGGGSLYYRTTSSIGTTPYPFAPWKDLTASSAPSTPSNESGLANDILVQDFSRRYGGRIKTSGKGAIAFRFDHGLANYRDMIKPLMDARTFKHSQVINSRSWGLAENTGVTEAIVDGWVQEGLLEIWNHGGLGHSDADTPEKLYDAIVNGLAELRAQIPSASIDGWAIPGVQGTKFMGFDAGISPEKFYGTEAGRLILAHHAVSTGHIPNTYQRVLDGVVRQGQHQYTLDSRTVAQATTEIDSAIANGTGLQIMLHPSVVNGVDMMSLADFTTILDYVKTKETAGELVVLSPYELMVADKF